MSEGDGLGARVAATPAKPVLADSSVWGWRHRFPPLLADAFAQAVVRGAVATCDHVRLELLRSARSADDFRTLRSDLARLPDAPIGKRQWVRALDVYGALAGEGPRHHRRVKQPDLLIAAAAEAAGWALLHYDADFELIANVTRERCVAVAGVGSL